MGKQQVTSRTTFAFVIIVLLAALFFSSYESTLTGFAVTSKQPTTITVQPANIPSQANVPSPTNVPVAPPGTSRILTSGSLTITNFNTVQTHDTVTAEFNTELNSNPVDAKAKLTYWEDANPNLKYTVEYQTRKLGVYHIIRAQGLKPGTTYTFEVEATTFTGARATQQFRRTTNTYMNTQTINIEIDRNHPTHTYNNPWTGSSLTFASGGGLSGSPDGDIEPLEKGVIHDTEYDAITSLRLNALFTDFQPLWNPPQAPHTYDSSLPYPHFNPQWTEKLYDNFFIPVAQGGPGLRSNINKIVINIAGIPVDLAEFVLEGKCTATQGSTVITIENNGFMTDRNAPGQPQYQMNQDWSQIPERRYMTRPGHETFASHVNWGVHFLADTDKEYYNIYNPTNSHNTLTLGSGYYQIPYNTAYGQNRVNEDCIIFQFNEWGNVRDKPMNGVNGYPEYHDLTQAFVEWFIMRYGTVIAENNVLWEIKNEPELGIFEPHLENRRFWNVNTQGGGGINDADWDELARLYDAMSKAITDAYSVTNADPAKAIITHYGHAGVAGTHSTQPLLNLPSRAHLAPSTLCHVSDHHYGHQYMHFMRNEDRLVQTNWGGLTSRGLFAQQPYNINLANCAYYQTEIGSNVLPFRNDLTHSSYAAAGLWFRNIMEHDMAYANHPQAATLHGYPQGAIGYPDPAALHTEYYHHGLATLSLSQNGEQGFGIVIGLDRYDKPTQSRNYAAAPAYSGVYKIAQLMDQGEVYPKTYDKSGVISIDSLDEQDQKFFDVLPVYDSTENKLRIVLTSFFDEVWADSGWDGNPQNPRCGQDGKKCYDTTTNIHTRYLVANLNVQGFTPSSAKVYHVHSLRDVWLEYLANNNPQATPTLTLQDKIALQQAGSLKQQEVSGDERTFRIPPGDIVVVEYDLTSYTNGATRPCDTYFSGSCAQGIQTYDANNKQWSVCVPPAMCGSGSCVDNDRDTYNAIDPLCTGSDDCDDTNPLVNPGEPNTFCDCNSATGSGSTNGVPEICDQLDNDCDGRIDEGLSCSFGPQTLTFDDEDFTYTPTTGTWTYHGYQGIGTYLDDAQRTNDANAFATISIPNGRWTLNVWGDTPTWGGPEGGVYTITHDGGTDVITFNANTVNNPTFVYLGGPYTFNNNQGQVRVNRAPPASAWAWVDGLQLIEDITYTTHP